MIKQFPMHVMVFLLTLFTLYSQAQASSKKERHPHQSVTLSSCGGSARIRPSPYSLLTLESVLKCKHVIDEKAKTQHTLFESGGYSFLSLLIPAEESFRIQVRSQSGFFRDYKDLSILASPEDGNLPNCEGNAKLTPLVEVEILNSKHCNTLVILDSSQMTTYHQLNVHTEKYAVPAVGGDPTVLLRSELGQYQDEIPLQFRCFDQARSKALAEANRWFIQSVSGSYLSRINEEVSYRFLIRSVFGLDLQFDVTMDRLTCEVVALSKRDSEE